ncbi:hypothetical protein SSX86_015838 [Deinandra increscens subsp. villosa]|uniref:Uncharacterized protein n=1 Tax=Deinandra increscens subsp. villosa TaxID=3103831 RepID=A0AAP0GWK8_9ASTR
MMHLKEKFEHLKTPLEAITLATNNFDPKNCIGGGGFGKVYKGELLLSDIHKLVALKRLDPKFGQGNPEFWKEIITLSMYKHENIVSLLGFCDEGGEKILVYDYASKGSLDSYLDKDDLKWILRLKICIGAARGLAYLHDPGVTHQRVLHRDIKSSNILLDENWNVRISDLGLSKFGPANQQYTFLVSDAVGTVGYCDPLYVETGLLTKESDVYSFGVVLFEVVCGRLSIGNSGDKRRPLTGLVRQHYEENKINEILHASLKDEITQPCLQEFTAIAYKCISRDLKERPLMTEVLSKLEISLQYQEQTKEQVDNMYLLPRTLELQNLDSSKALNKSGGILNVKVLKAMKLKKMGLLGASDPYVKIKLTESMHPSKKTTVKHKNLNPEWNEEFSMVVITESQAVEFRIYDYEQVGKHAMMGMNVVPLKELVPHEPKTLTLDLLENMYLDDIQNEKSRGQFMVELLYKPFKDDGVVQKASEGTPPGGGELVVVVHEAQDVEGKHHTNPYVRILFKGEEKKTKHIKKDRYPRWDEVFKFQLEEPPVNERLHVEVVSISSRIGLLHPKESLGYVDISLGDVVHNSRINENYYLIDSRNGKIQIELQWRTVS